MAEYSMSLYAGPDLAMAKARFDSVANYLGVPEGECDRVWAVCSARGCVASPRFLLFDEKLARYRR